MEVVAVADAGSGAAARLGGDHVAYSDWRELLARDDIGLVDIVSPPAAQKTIVLEALKKGHHVLCEKPFGARLEDAIEMCRAQRPDRIAAVGYQFRFEPAFRELRRLLNSGSIGDLLRVDVRWVTAGRANPECRWGFQHDADVGGGVGNAFLSHVVDYILWTTQASLSVDGGTRRVFIDARTDSDGVARKVTAEDSADFLARLDGMVPVNVVVSNCLIGGEGHRVEFYGRLGCLSLVHRPPFGALDLELIVHRDGRSEPQKFEACQSEGDSRLPTVRALLAELKLKIEGIDVSDLPTFKQALVIQEVLGKWRSVAPIQ